MSFAKAVAITAATILSSSVAVAGPFTINPSPVSGSAGDTVTFQLVHTQDGTPLMAADGKLNFDAAVFDVSTLSNTAGDIAGAACVSQDFNFADLVPPLEQMPSGTVCTFSIQLQAGQTAGTKTGAITFEAVGGIYTVTGNPVDVTIVDNSPVGPTFSSVLTQIPSTPQPYINGSSQNGNIQFTGSGAANGGTSDISCTAAAPFSIVSGGTQTGLGNGDAAPVEFNCAVASSSVNGNISCNVAGTTETFDVSCPEGRERPDATVPPTPEVVPASSHLSQLLLVILLGMFGMGAVYLVRRS